MPEADPTAPFYLIVTDHDCGVFAVEGPRIDDRPWLSAAQCVRDPELRITWGPTVSLSGVDPAMPRSTNMRSTVKASRCGLSRVYALSVRAPLCTCLPPS
jgi:hypothetical protein